MGGIITAKKRFIEGSPVKAGLNYKHTINGKQYIFQAKYDKTLSEFNAMWFNNLTPKEYFFSRSKFDSFTGIIMPYDEIVVDGIRHRNESIGALTKAELEVLFDEYKEARLVSGLLLTGNEDHRIHKIKIRPFRNSNSEELKYFQIDNWSRNPIVKVFKINKPQVVVFEVIETFTPARSVSASNHNCTINHVGFSVTFQGTLPVSTTETTVTYSIPNAITSKKLTVTPNGSTSLLLKFE